MANGNEATHWCGCCVCGSAYRSVGRSVAIFGRSGNILL